MDVTVKELLLEILKNGLSLIINFIIIIVPIIVILEILIQYKLVEKISSKFRFIEKLFGIKKEAVLPLLIGLLIGITYAAGAIKTIKDEGNISKRDLSLIGVFLFSCHGIIETSILLGFNGASVIYVLVIRVLIATILTFLASRTIFKLKAKP